MIPGLPMGRPFHRTVSRARMLDHLMAHGWLFEAEGAARQAADQALDRLLALGLPQSEGRFDPVEVMNGFRAAGRAGLDPTWAEHLIPNARRLVTPGYRTDRPPDLSTLADRDYEVALTRSFHLPSSDRVRLRLPLPLDLAGPAVLTCSLPLAETRTGEGWADFRLSVSRAVDITCSARMKVRGRVQSASRARLTPEERELYTRPREGLICVTPRIQDLADRLAGSQTDPGQQVAGFLDFLDETLCQGALAHDQLNPEAPGDLVLDEGWYDCVAGSALLASLCRARAIPARLVGGYGLYSAASGAHNWIEIWLEQKGWTPFDLTSLELGQGGGGQNWRNRFLGQLDHRMVVERLPRYFAGPGSLRLPPAWHLLARREAGGVAHDLVDAVSGAQIYSESVSVEPLDV